MRGPQACFRLAEVGDVEAKEVEGEGEKEESSGSP